MSGEDKGEERWRDNRGGGVSSMNGIGTPSWAPNIPVEAFLRVEDDKASNQ